MGKQIEITKYDNGWLFKDFELNTQKVFTILPDLLTAVAHAVTERGVFSIGDHIKICKREEHRNDA